MADTKNNISNCPDALVAIAYGSHQAGHTRLKKMAVSELLQRYGIRLSFVRRPSRPQVAS